MKKKILAIQGSEINKINYNTDTSLFLALEAQKRKFDIYYYEPKNLSFNNGKVLAKCVRIQVSNNQINPNPMHFVDLRVETTGCHLIMS